MDVLLDGRKLAVADGETLAGILPARDPRCSIAVVRPGAARAAETQTLLFTTTRGEVRVELGGPAAAILDDPAVKAGMPLRWADRYAAAFGPFPATFSPAREPRTYERGDVLLGCGGYDPRQSYLIFSRLNHLADHGAAGDGGILGRVVSGRGVLDRWGPGDRIERMERVMSWEDRTTSFTTTDRSLRLEDGMQVVSRVEAVALGYGKEAIDTREAATVEHLLMALEKGTFTVHRAASTHIRDESRMPADLPRGEKGFRGEGVITVRWAGAGRGAVYLYRADLPGHPAHTVAGQVVHGIELVRLAREGEVICIEVAPARLDLVGLPATEAVARAEARGVRADLDAPAAGRVVAAQEPATTLEVLAEKAVTLTTVAEEKVIGIRLDDEAAPVTCGIFRHATGLAEHALGSMKFLFSFEDVFLFRPALREGVKVLPENNPAGEVPAWALGMTNDSRRGVGTVGVRAIAHAEFGPTAEPFEGTNIIGTVMEREKLRGLKDKEIVYIREIA